MPGQPADAGDEAAQEVAKNTAANIGDDGAVAATTTGGENFH